MKLHITLFLLMIHQLIFILNFLIWFFKKKKFQKYHLEMKMTQNSREKLGIWAKKYNNCIIPATDLVMDMIFDWNRFNWFRWRERMYSWIRLWRSMMLSMNCLSWANGKWISTEGISVECRGENVDENYYDYCYFIASFSS